MPIYRAGRRTLLTHLYAGTQVTCPLCERSFRKLLANGICPCCRSLERHRFLWLYLAEEWRKRPRPLEVLLHFAPEYCLQNRLASDPRVAGYLTTDLTAPEAEVHTDITSMKFPNGAFDAVICCHVLEHIPADRTAMRELVRVLRPGAVAYIQVPLNWESSQTDEDPDITDPEERLRRFGQVDHVRVYGRDFPDRLHAAGFEVTEIKAANLFSVAQMAYYGIADEIIWRCVK